MATSNPTEEWSLHHQVIDFDTTKPLHSETILLVVKIPSLNNLFLILFSSEHQAFSSPSNLSLITVKSEQDKTLSPGNITNVVEILENIDGKEMDKENGDIEEQDELMEDEVMEEEDEQDELDEETEKVQYIGMDH